MLVKGSKRLVLVIAPLLVFLYLCLTLFSQQGLRLGLSAEWLDHSSVTTSTSSLNGTSSSADELSFSSHHEDQKTLKNYNDILTTLAAPIAADISYHEIFSLSTPDRKYFPINFGSQTTLNPNMIPHPSKDDIWIIVAQEARPQESRPTGLSVELTCNAAFHPSSGALECTDTPSLLPIAATESDRCTGALDVLGFNVGPHDARVFWGPRAPFVLYGTQSAFTCFGQWVQDLRVLVDWGLDLTGQELTLFRAGTELQRPAPWGAIEKNFFAFWDAEGRMFAHYDVSPRRVFAAVSADGSAGPDLAPLAAGRGDDACMARYMPALPPSPPDAELESIHQASNSLAVTLCRRSDGGCEQTDDNTFVFHIFQHKTFYHFHSQYEPYVMLFRRREPFEVFAISRKPLWIHGRQRHDAQRSDMFYVTSMSWKKKGQRYHGYLDDVLFIGFGVEDERTGGIDVRAEDILMGLGLCSDLS